MSAQRTSLLTRRSMLGALGVGASVAPFLPLLNASGQESTLPRRIVLFFTPHGTLFNRWTPTGTETDFALSPLLAPLERFKDKLVVIDGMGIREGSGPGAPHTKGPALLWTASPLLNEPTFVREDGSGGPTFGWNSAASFDQVLAQRFAGTTPYRSLELGVHSDGGYPGTHMIYSGPRTPVSPIQDPHAAYDTLFADRMRPTDDADRLRAERRAVLEFARQELRPLHTRVAREDRLKIEQHYQTLADLEATLGASGGGVDCGTLARPGDRGATNDIPWSFDRQIEILAAAMSCDLMRIASLQYRVGENDGITYPWLGLEGFEHHIKTHSTAPADEDGLAIIYTWYAERFAYLLERFDAIPEGDGTMLDHTMVIWGSEIGTGWNHAFNRVPFVVAGGGAHGIRTRRFLNAGGVGHNRVIVSAMNFMGAEEIETFGATDDGRGGLSGLMA